MVFTRSPRLSKPGLFVTATDTGVGKTVVTCAVAHALRQQGLQVGVCKPFATGCDRGHDGLVSPDAQALAHYSACPEPLDVINPIRYAPPLAPAAASREAATPPDYTLLARCLETIDSQADVLLIEGIGGVMVPLDDQHTVLDLAAALGYPVIVVTRPGLGTLNHTAMTVRLLRLAGCEVAGLVVNQYPPGDGDTTDPSVTSNRAWLEQMNDAPVLATVPRCAANSEASEVAAWRGHIPSPVLEAIGAACWRDVLKPPCYLGTS